MLGTPGCDDRKAKTSGNESPLSQSFEIAHGEAFVRFRSGVRFHRHVNPRRSG